MQKYLKKTLKRFGNPYTNHSSEWLTALADLSRWYGEDMRCPQCDNDSPLAWKRYIKAPLGRMSCPSCHAKLVTTHRWFYWPLMISGCCILGIPLAILGANYGVAGAMMGFFIGAFG